MNQDFFLLARDHSDRDNLVVVGPFTSLLMAAAYAEEFNAHLQAVGAGTVKDNFWNLVGAQGHFLYTPDEFRHVVRHRLAD